MNRRDISIISMAVILSVQATGWSTPKATPIQATTLPCGELSEGALALEGISANHFISEETKTLARRAAARWILFLPHAVDRVAFETLISKNDLVAAEKFFWGHAHFYQPFQLATRCAVYPGGLDLLIFDLFPNLNIVHFINHVPFRIPFLLSNLTYRSPGKDETLNGLQAFNQMKKDYIQVSGGALIGESLQQRILFGTQKQNVPQIGMEPFILADLERRSTHIIESQQIAGEHSPAFRIRFVDWRGVTRTLFYSQSDAYADAYSRVLEEDLRAHRVDLLFFKAFTQHSEPFERVMSKRPLPRRLFDLGPGALYVSEEYHHRSVQGGFGVENYADILPRLKSIGQLGGRKTPWEELGHFFESIHPIHSPARGSLTVYQYQPLAFSA